MDLITLLRAAITSGGGTPAFTDRIGLLQQLVATYGGTPTKFTVTGLLREAIIARGGTPTQQTITALLRELIVVLGATPTTYTEQALLVQLAGLSIGGVTLPPAPAFTTQPSISPTSGTAGVTAFTATNGVASNTTSYTRRWLLDGSAMSTASFFTPPSAGSLVLEVTANGAGGATIATTAAVTVAAAGGGGDSGFPSSVNAALPNFGLELANAPTAYPPQFNLLNLEGLLSGDVLWIVRSNDAGGTTGLTYYSHTLTDADLGMTQPVSLTFAGLSDIASGDYYYAPATQRGSERSAIGTAVVHGSSTVAPTITSSASPSGAQFVAGSATLTANQTISTWAVVGGADQANFSFVGASLNWTSFATTGAKAVTVRATNAFGISTDQSITLTVAANTASAFTFTDASGVPLSSTQTSNTITVAGITTAPVPVSITGGTYSKNGGGYTSAAGTAANGDTFAVRVTASGSYLTGTNAVLTIGSTSDTYTATTLADPAVPAGFAATTGTNKYSTVTVSGTNNSVAQGVASAGIRGVRIIPASASADDIEFSITMSNITGDQPIYIGVDSGTRDWSATNDNPAGTAKTAYLNAFGDGGTTNTWLIGDAYALFQVPATNQPTGGLQNGDIVIVRVKKSTGVVRFFHKRGGTEVQVGTNYALTSMSNWFGSVAASQSCTWTLDATLWGVP